MSGTPVTTQPQRREHDGRAVRIAALGDVHFDGTAHGSLIDIFSDAARQANILVLCGDLTTHGRAEQMRGFVEELKGVDIPIVGVLGNHDYEAGETQECVTILRDRGVHMLDGDYVIIEDIGFAGVKGFCGGFGRGALAPFGEPELKQFVQTSLDEAIKLENALRNLSTSTRVALLHYSPIADTVVGEPPEIFPFLGSSRLLQPIDTLGADVVFHGHAHHGTLEGTTTTGVPVVNVSYPVLMENGRRFYLWELQAPDRRAAGATPGDQP